MSFPASNPDHVAAAWTGGPVDGRLTEFVEESLERLEIRLVEICEDLARGIGGLPEVLAGAVGTEGRGGRRWRPLLTLAAAEALPGCREDALDAAVAVELTHTASLVLDDMPCMDDSPLRRGQPATHRRVGSAGAILLSVGLLARAVELLGRSACCGDALCQDWGRTVGLQGMAGGQAMDVAAKAPLRGAARRLHRAKSTLLPAFALSSGARMAGASEATVSGLESFGRSLGWAYQLIDDAEDLEEDARQHGREPEGIAPLSLSHRIMQRAYRRLRCVPGLREDGVEILVGLAGQVVMPEFATERSPSPAFRTGRA